MVSAFMFWEIRMGGEGAWASIGNDIPAAKICDEAYLLFKVLEIEDGSAIAEREVMRMLCRL
jgi:hypothetical protein